MPTHVTESTGATVTATWEFTTGTLQVSSAGSFQVNTIAERDAASGVTIDGVLVKDGGVTLTTPLAIAYGGTASATSPTARTALGVAALGANSDITSLSGLTTALSVAQGGTGGVTLPMGAVLVGNETNTITTLSAGTSGTYLASAGTGTTPVWSQPYEYVEILVNAPTTANSASSNAARFVFPFAGTIQQAAAGVSTAPTGSTLAVDVHINTTTIFTTKLYFDQNETTSRTATTATAINTGANTFSAWDLGVVHIDSDGNLGASSTGLWIVLICTRS